MRGQGGPNKGPISEPSGSIDTFVEAKYADTKMSTNKVRDIVRSDCPEKAFEQYNAQLVKRGNKPYSPKFYEEVIIPRIQREMSRLHGIKMSDPDIDVFVKRDMGQALASSKRASKMKKDVIRDFNKNKKVRDTERRQPRQFDDISASAYDYHNSKVINKANNARSGVHPSKDKQLRNQAVKARAKLVNLSERQQHIDSKKKKYEAKKARQAANRKQKLAIEDNDVVKTESGIAPLIDFFNREEAQNEPNDNHDSQSRHERYYKALFGADSPINQLEGFVREFTNDYRLKDLVAMLIYIRQCYYSKNTTDFSCAYFQYKCVWELEPNVLPSLIEGAIIGKFAMWLKNKSNTEDLPVVTESFSDTAEGIVGFLKQTLSASFVKLTVEVVLMLASYKYFPAKYTKDLYNCFGKPAKMTVVEAINLLATGMLRMIKLGESLLQGVPFYTALFEDDPITALFKEVENNMVFENLLYVGLPVEGMMDRREFVANLERHLNAIDVMLEKGNPYGDSTKRLEGLRFRLFNALNKQLSQMKGQRRAAPFAILLTGHPGVGKSKITPFLYDTHCRVKGREFNDGMVYAKNPDDDYYEGHNPLSQPYMFFSEVGRISKAMVQKTGDSSLSELCSIIDNNPKMLKMAFEDKGKIFCMPELCVLDSNNPGLHLKELYSNPAAYARRFLYIEQTVKEEFQMKGSCMIDTKKAEEADGDILDRYWFKVWKQIPSNARDSVTQIVADHIDVYELSTLLTTLFTEHMAKEERMLDRFRSTRNYDAYHNVDKFNVDPPMHDEKEDYPYVFPTDGWNDEAPEEVKTESGGFYAYSLERVVKTPLMKFKQYTKGLGSAFYDFTKLFAIATVLNIIGMVGRSESRSPLVFSSLRLALALVYLTSLYVMDLRFLIGFAFLFFMNFEAWLAYQFDAATKSVATTANMKLKISFDRLRHFLGLGGRFTFFTPTFISERKNWMRVLGMVTIIMAIGGFTYQAHKRNKKKKTIKSEAHTRFFNESEHDSKIQEYEESFNCARAPVKVPVKGSAIWNTQFAGTSAVHSGTASQLYKSCGKNIRICHLEFQDREPSRTFILGIEGNIAIINRHALGDMSKHKTLVKCCTGTAMGVNSELRAQQVWQSTLIGKEDVVELTTDLVLIQLNGLSFSKSIQKHISPDDIHLGCVKGMIENDNVNAYFHTDAPLPLSDSFVGTVIMDRYFKYQWQGHYPGACGLPLIGNKGNGVALLGIHVGSGGALDFSYAVPLTKEIIDSALIRLKNQDRLLPICSEALNLDVETPNPKSILRHQYCGGIEYYGKAPGKVCVNNRSRITKFPNGKMFRKVLKEALPGTPNEFYAPPRMAPFHNEQGEYVYAYNLAMTKISKQKTCLDRSILLKVIDVYEKHIFDTLDRPEFSMHPLTIEEAINGAERDPTIRRMNASTSAGWGLRGKKKDYLPIVDDSDNRILREPIDVIRKKILKSLQSYSDGERTHPVFSMKLKDEPRPLAKVESGSTRVFSAAETTSVIIGRMFFAPLYSLMAAEGDAFGTSVGINMHSGADDHVKELLAFSKYILEGDYGAFDQSIPFEVSWAAATLQQRIFKRCGYNEKALEIVRGILSDNLYPVCEMNLDLFCAPGLQVSGKYGTAEDNSMKGIILLMYAFYSNKSLMDLNFFEYVRPKTYGDDLQAAVHHAVLPVFNNQTYQRFCRDVYGMKFTSATKSEVMEHHLSIHESSFLKRRFVFRKDLDRWVAPLSINSLYRMVTWTLPSTSIPQNMQTIDTINSLLWELVLHLEKADHDRVRGEFLKILVEQGEEDLEYVEGKLPEYEHIVEDMFGAQ